MECWGSWAAPGSAMLVSVSALVVTRSAVAELVVAVAELVVAVAELVVAGFVVVDLGETEAVAYWFWEEVGMLKPEEAESLVLTGEDGGDRKFR